MLSKSPPKFIFGGKPYQVNDAVNIDNTWYKVHKIGVLETKFLDANNKLTRYSNQYLCDVKIVGCRSVAPREVAHEPYLCVR